MEIALNLAWAFCSLGLVWIWMRSGASSRTSRSAQVLVLAMVMLLLLPVISLSDDLVAWQNPAEADSSLRRATHRGDAHTSIVPATFGLLSLESAAQHTQWIALSAAPIEAEMLPASLFVPSHFSRPPPQV